MTDNIADTLKKLRDKGVDDESIAQSLSQHPVYGPRMKALTDKGVDSTSIIDSLVSGPQITPQATTPMDIVRGVGSGAASTLTGTRDLAAKIYQRATKMETPTGTQQPFGALPDVPATFRKFGETPENASPGFKVAKAGEQLSEFFLPGAAAAKVGKIAETTSKAVVGGSKLADLVATGSKMMGEAAGAAAGTGLITGAQTGGDPNAMAQAAILGGATTGAFSTIGKLLESVPPGWAYKGLKFPKDVPRAQISEIFRDALDRGINVSPTGVEKAADYTTAASGRTAAALAQPGVSQAPISFSNIEDGVNRLLQTSTRPPGTVAPLVPKFDRQILEAWNDFKTAYGGQPAVPPTTIQVPGPNPKATLTPAGMPRTVTVPGTPAIAPHVGAQDAQAAKKALQDILDTAYGKYSDNPDEALKVIAGGLRRDLERIAPAVRESNRDAQNSLLMTDALEKYVKNHGYASHPYILTGSLIASMGLPGHYGLFSLPPAILLEALSNPRIRSVLAISANRAGKVMQKVAPYVGPAAAASQTPNAGTVFDAIPSMPGVQ